MQRAKQLRRASKSLCATKRAQRRAYREAAESEEPTWCIACGSTQHLEHSHIVSQRQYPQHRNNPLNWVLLCHACHLVYEHEKWRFARLYPDAFAEKMRRLEALDAAAFRFFQLKHESLFPPTA